jgi:hypothetical protein
MISEELFGDSRIVHSLFITVANMLPEKSMSSLVVTDQDFRIESCCSESYKILEEEELLGKNIFQFIRIEPKTKECRLIKNNRRLFCSQERQPKNYIFRIKGSVSLLDSQEEEYLLGRTDKMTAITISSFGLITECLLNNEFLGFEPQEMLFRPIMSFVHLNDLPQLFCALKQPSYRSRIPIRWRKRPESALIPPAQMLFIDSQSFVSSSTSTRRKSIAEGSFPLIPYLCEEEAEYIWVELTITKKQELILFLRILDYSEIPSPPLLQNVIQTIKEPKKMIGSTFGYFVFVLRQQVRYIKVSWNNKDVHTIRGSQSRCGNTLSAQSITSPKNEILHLLQPIAAL